MRLTADICFGTATVVPKLFFLDTGWWAERKRRERLMSGGDGR
jgi:hypothetical protein